MHYKNYSVLGHMDLIKRYDQEGEYPFEKIKPVIEDILKIVIADGKGIEINTRRNGMDWKIPCPHGKYCDYTKNWEGRSLRSAATVISRTSWDMVSLKLRNF